MAAHRTWLFVVASIVFWTAPSPLALVWLAVWLTDRYQMLVKTPTAKRERRVRRLLGWYPATWRARYGEEMAARLHVAITDDRAARGATEPQRRRGPDHAPRRHTPHRHMPCPERSPVSGHCAERTKRAGPPALPRPTQTGLISPG